LDSWLKNYEFLRFQTKFEDALSHCQCGKMCPKLPKFAQRPLG
jgi:hypothetical protein